MKKKIGEGQRRQWKEQRKEGRHEVKDFASSNDLKGDYIGILRKNTQGDIYAWRVNKLLELQSMKSKQNWGLNSDL